MSTKCISITMVILISSDNSPVITWISMTVLYRTYFIIDKIWQMSNTVQVCNEYNIIWHFQYPPWYLASVPYLPSAFGLGQILGTLAKYQGGYWKHQVILSIYYTPTLLCARITHFQPCTITQSSKRISGQKLSISYFARILSFCPHTAFRPSPGFATYREWSMGERRLQSTYSERLLHCDVIFKRK